MKHDPKYVAIARACYADYEAHTEGAPAFDSRSDEWRHGYIVATVKASAMLMSEWQCMRASHCLRPRAERRLQGGSTVYSHGSAQVCGACFTALYDAENEARCVICNDIMPHDYQDVTCSSKCERTMDRRNKRGQDAA